MRIGVAVVATALALGMVPRAARADVLWWQMPNDSMGVASSQQGGAWQTRSADDFLLPIGNGGRFALGLVKARLISNLGTDPLGYFMEIYADAGGVPGEMIVHRGAYLVDSFGFDVLRRPVVQPRFFADVELDAGTRYWVSVGGFSGAESAAGFATHNLGAAASILSPAMHRAGTGAWGLASLAINPGIRDLAFQIEGVQLNPPPPPDPSAPAPGPAALLALAGAAAQRRRRRD
ncbi:MAG: hypothetical protein AB7K52_08735 [Phycisphaerales bacterium]